MVKKELKDQIIKMYLNGCRACDIQKELNVSLSDYYKALDGVREKRLEIRSFTDEQRQDIVNRYLSGESSVAIGRSYGFKTHKPICSLLNSLGYDTNRHNGVRKYHIDEDYFEVIDTPNKAYHLGMFYADGSNNPKKGTASISLEENDKEILEKLRADTHSEKELEFLDYSNKHDFGYTYKNQYRLLYFSRKICSDLVDKGVVPNKSLVIQFPNFLDDSLMSHFIRGVFDGDGSMGVYDVSKLEHNNSLDISIISTYDFCIQLSQYLSSIGIFSKVSNPISKNGINATIHFPNKNNKKLFLDWMYYDAELYLQRKYDIYKTFYNI